MKETQKKISTKIAGRVDEARNAIESFEDRFACFAEAKVMTNVQYQEQMKTEVRNRETIR